MKLPRLLLSLCITMLCLPTQARIDIVDDAGNHIVLAGQAQRIISLAPHLTELLFAAGAGHRLVGVVEYSDYPAPALTIPRIGNYKLLDLEQILALQPDLVVAWQSGNPPAQLQKLRSLGLPVYVSEPRSLEDIAITMQRLGVMAGSDEEAQVVAKAFMASYTTLLRDNEGKQEVSVFYQIWGQPLITVNGSHLISDVIRACGGRNIFAEASSLTPTISHEAVIKADPEVIVASGVDARRPEWLDEWRLWSQLKAVQGNHLYVIPPDLMHRHTPRILDGMRMMCEYLDRARGRIP